MGVKLSDEQNDALDKIHRWIKSGRKRFVLSGYAGTGKSTLAAVLNENLNDVRFCAYTGKAANVLRDKGCNANTIHGSIYVLKEEKKDGEPVFKLDLDSSIKSADLVIVDEYSMLPDEIIDDLERLAKRVLYLGDPFQLPPVKGLCNLQADLTLTHVHRQALDSPILKAATDVREGREINFTDTGGDFIYLPRKDTSSEMYDNADQIIVGYNKTRQAWNQRFRMRLGFDDEKSSNPYPQDGEKIICLRNNHERGLFNGMIGTCYGSEVISRNKLKLGFESFYKFEAWSCYFDGELKPPYNEKGIEHFDFGYVITAHKSQGSEFDNVLIYNQPIGRGIDRQRWLYTAITRAKKKCVLVEP